jgi:predicted nucleotidyltransferase
VDFHVLRQDLCEAPHWGSPTSDLDLLVRVSKRKSLLAVVRLERGCSEALGRKVDLLIESALSPYWRDRILSEMRVVFGER